MTKTSVLRYAAIGMASLSLAGFAAASTVTLGTTGPSSLNKVHLNDSNKVSSFNYNGVGATNVSSQGAGTGYVYANDNTTVGPGTSGSGSSSNDNGTQNTVSVDNSSSNAALGALAGMSPADDTVSLDTTGPSSKNEVNIDHKNSFKSTNINSVGLTNVSTQNASTGNVTATDNTTVGGLKSGDSSNSNTTINSVDIHN
jgi:hypothetical protein